MSNTEVSTDTPAPPAKKKRGKRPRNYVLVEVTTADGDPDHVVFDPIDMGPLELPTDKVNRENEIKAACKRALYERGLKDFGNKNLAIISVGETFRFDFEEVTQTLLVPADK